MIGTISVRNIEFLARHGATAEERETLHPFQVDLDIHTDVARAAASDRLGDTVDYDELCRLTVEIGTTRTYHLLEALAGALASAIVERHPSVGLQIEVRKLRPPSPGRPAYTAVRVAVGASA